MQRDKIEISRARADPTQDFDQLQETITDSRNIGTGRTTHTFETDETIVNSVPSVSVIKSDGTILDVNYTWEKLSSGDVEITINNQTGAAVDVDITVSIYYLSPPN